MLAERRGGGGEGRGGGGGGGGTGKRSGQREQHELQNLIMMVSKQHTVETWLDS